MTQEKSLKATYRPHVAAFAVVDILLFWVVVVAGSDIDAIDELLGKVSWKDGAYVVLAPILVLILNGLLSALDKTRLVYWRWRDPLPGSAAFSDYIERDPDRIDRAELQRKWGEFPLEPQLQNSLWYKMYNGVESDVRVRDGHRNWLFARDLTAYSALFLLIFGPSTIFASAPLKVWYLLFLFFQYGLLMFVSRTYGARFITTVLAVESHRST